MLQDIEIAKTYYLAPGDTESKYYIGGKDELNHLVSLMVKGDLIATAGVNGEECTLLVTWSDKECEEMIERSREVMKENFVKFLEGKEVEEDE